MTNEDLLDKIMYSQVPTVTILERGEYRAELLRRLGSAVSASAQPDFNGAVTSILANCAARYANPRLVYALDPQSVIDKQIDNGVEILKQFFAAAPAQEPKVECKARKVGTAGGSYPQDCDWPFCGCDPKAEKVISTLLECGWNPPQRAHPAAPQPVSGIYVSETKPHKVDDARIAEIFNREPVSGNAPGIKCTNCGMYGFFVKHDASLGSLVLKCVDCGEQKLIEDQAGDAPKVEEIAQKVYDAVIGDDVRWLSDAELLETIAAILRPYFPPASQTPQIDLNDVREDIGDAIQALRSGWPADDVINILKECSESINLPATPASTARTDGWVSAEERLPKSDDDREYVQVCWKEEWRGRKLSTNPDDNSIASPSGIDTCFIPYFVARHYHQATHWRHFSGAAQPGDDKPEGRE